MVSFVDWVVRVVSFIFRIVFIFYGIGCMVIG